MTASVHTSATFHVCCTQQSVRWC